MHTYINKTAKIKYIICVIVTFDLLVGVDNIYAIEPESTCPANNPFAVIITNIIGNNKPAILNKIFPTTSP